jgi:hypothetical protein
MEAKTCTSVVAVKVRLIAGISLPRNSGYSRSARNRDYRLTGVRY